MTPPSPTPGWERFSLAVGVVCLTSAAGFGGLMAYLLYGLLARDGFTALIGTLLIGWSIPFGTIIFRLVREGHPGVGPQMFRFWLIMLPLLVSSYLFAVVMTYVLLTVPWSFDLDYDDTYRPDCPRCD